MLQVSGRGGELRVGYQVVATFGRWHISDAGQMEVESLANINRFWFEREDVSFSIKLPMGKREWAWGSVEVVGRSSPLLIVLHGDPSIR